MSLKVQKLKCKNYLSAKKGCDDGDARTSAKVQKRKGMMMVTIVKYVCKSALPKRGKSIVTGYSQKDLIARLAQQNWSISI